MNDLDKAMSLQTGDWSESRRAWKEYAERRRQERFDAKRYWQLRRFLIKYCSWSDSSFEVVEAQKQEDSKG